MNTIVRTDTGWVDVYKTVVETVKVLKVQTGYISFQRIQETINAQLPNRREHVTKKMVVQSLVKLVDKSHKKAIDK